MRLGDEDAADEVLLLYLRPAHPVAAAALLAVLRKRHALHVAPVGERDDAGLVGDEVLHRDLVCVVDDLRAAGRVGLRGVALLQVREVRAHQGVYLLGVGQKRLVARNRLDTALELLGEPAALETDELVEAHLENGCRLRLREAEVP